MSGGGGGAGTSGGGVGARAVAWLSQQDPDDWFAYSTIKLVSVRDRYLGILHYAFQIMIFVYIIVYGLCLRSLHGVDWPTVFFFPPPLIFRQFRDHHQQGLHEI